MPSDTFFNLPKEKQRRILEAAKKEFSRASLNEASIANVIKDAEIPRGSFYQYFENKEDLYYYCFHTLGRDSHQMLIDVIQKADGDLFAGFEDYFARLLPEIFSGENALFYKNVFMGMDYHGFHRVVPHLHKRPELHHQAKKSEHKKHQQELLAAINRDTLKVHDDQELQLLLQLLMHTVFSTIADGYRRCLGADVYDVAQISKNFASKINWLKHGARKEQDK